ncbi:Hypothetical predicted protein [Paramuricea clavata]|uniref:Uncharacterized protein n=1 Tax=Paramuricea clavata TaxID=317549 RepID=A0A7D9HVJ4_PARCT|nr:Hypothetical predicted protein [Paramuricea clavata]
MSKDNQPTLQLFYFSFSKSITFFLLLILPLKGYRLDTTVIKYVHAKSGVDCILQCMLQDKSCRSANFRKTPTSGGKQNCELLKTVDSEEPPGKLENDQNFDYYKLLQPERKPEDAVSSSTCPQVAETISTRPCNSGEAAFGVRNGRIQDSQITASSIHSARLSTKQGRLNGASSWSARQNDQNQWIQVDLGRDEVVSAIGTQGRRNHPQWVDTYSVSYGSNGNAFEPYKIDDDVKVFSGNIDQQSIVTNCFFPAITARYIRIQPITWYGHISMRFEVYGCYTGPCKSREVAFGMQNGRIQDSLITASSIYWAARSTKQGRLNSASSWSAGENDQNPWIQVDLGREEDVTAIGTQGRGDKAQWVKTYSVSYGSNGSAFEPYKINDVVKTSIFMTKRNSGLVKDKRFNKKTNEIMPFVGKDDGRQRDGVYTFLRFEGCQKTYLNDCRVARLTLKTFCEAVELHDVYKSMDNLHSENLEDAKSCLDHYKSGNKTDDIYQINPDGHGNFTVMCDMNDGGWTVFQHRYDGSVDFNLGWTEYQEGFGNLSGEFWLGLEKLHRITTSEDTDFESILKISKEMRDLLNTVLLKLEVNKMSFG